jgi:hypothetical protein
MKDFVDYKNSPLWDKCSERHKKELTVPSVFISTLLFYQTREGFDLTDINFALETGTFMGDTTLIFSDYFSHVYTVEKFLEDNKYFFDTPEESKKEHSSLKSFLDSALRGRSNIFLKEGDSVPFIGETLAAHPDKRFLLLLDAHDENFTTLLLELEAIKLHSNRFDHIIMIDDGKFFPHWGTQGLGIMQGPHPSLEGINLISRESVYEGILNVNPEYTIIDTNLPQHMDFSGSGIIIAYPTK